MIKQSAVCTYCSWKKDGRDIVNYKNSDGIQNANKSYVWAKKVLSHVRQKKN